MSKPVQATEILAALPPEARADFQKQIKSEAGVTLNLKVSKGKRGRKGNWGSVKGYVVSARVSSDLYQNIKRCARQGHVTVGEFVAACCQWKMDEVQRESDYEHDR